jgi:hypothetical protein
MRAKEDNCTQKREKRTKHKKMQSKDNSRATEKIKQQREKRLVAAVYLLSLVMFILGLSYASVPLYQLFCQATGFGGTIQKSNASPSGGAITTVPAIASKSNGTENASAKIYESYEGNDIDNKNNSSENGTGTNWTTTSRPRIMNPSKEKGPENTAQIPEGINEESTRRNTKAKVNPENDKENKAITINFNADISNNLP